MTDREKLIELIINAKRADPGEGSFAEFLADFLIANGVTVQKTGRWIPYESDFDDDDALFDVDEWCDWQCSSCHKDICYKDPMERRWLPKYCPNCGAQMKEVEA